MSTVKSGGGRPPAYKLADGSRVPGCTTIVNRYKDSGGLIHWAYTQGVEGKDYRKTRDDAAGAGTLGHLLIDAAIHEHEPEIPTPRELGVQSDEDFETALKLAKGAFEAFDQWRVQTKLEIIETETPLISEKHRFGGTLDAVAKVLGRVVLLDWKTSNKIYPDYLVQLGGYDLLLEERREIRVEGAQLLRFGKEFADFHHHAWPRPVLDYGRRAFLLMRELYDIDAVLKKAAA